MSDLLSVLVGVALGVLASIPVSLAIAAATTPRQPRRRVLDVPYTESQETSVIVYEVTL